MKVRRVGKGSESCRHLRRARRVAWEPDIERRAQLHSTDADASSLESIEGDLWIFELDGEVTAIEAQAYVILQVFSRLVVCRPQRRGEHRTADGEKPLSKKRDRLVGVLERAV